MPRTSARRIWASDENALPLVQPVHEIAESEGAQVLVICAQGRGGHLPDGAGGEADVPGGAWASDRVRSGPPGHADATALLGLISYLTAGPKEVRAWTIEKGTKAPQAAGKIHSRL